MAHKVSPVLGEIQGAALVDPSGPTLGSDGHRDARSDLAAWEAASDTGESSLGKSICHAER